uniref:Uncharacterized protein n=1 Tax=Amazona collaria TaxID=241587 RepID=A0A8B9FN52_9PSIT
ILGVFLVSSLKKKLIYLENHLQLSVSSDLSICDKRTTPSYQHIIFVCQKFLIIKIPKFRVLSPVAFSWGSIELMCKM